MPKRKLPYFKKHFSPRPDLGKTLSYKGFTLVELLIVMAVIFILLAMAIYSFVGFRETVLLNEITNNIAQDVRTAQRAAMFLDKDEDERWLYGIGLDFRPLLARGNNDARYRMFKWCSPFSDFGAPPTAQNVPNITKPPSQAPYSFANGRIPGTTAYTEDCTISPTCTNNATCNVLLEMKDQGPKSVGTVLQPRFEGTASVILFESVSGRAFLYDASGVLLNYQLQGGQMVPVASPQPFAIELNAPASGNKTKITVRNISGVVSISKP